MVIMVTGQGVKANGLARDGLEEVIEDWEEVGGRAQVVKSRRRMRDYYSSWHCNMGQGRVQKVIVKNNIIVYWLTRLALAPFKLSPYTCLNAESQTQRRELPWPLSMQNKQTKHKRIQRINSRSAWCCH